ncbi:hypothetical protein Ahy_A09g043238 [Arachis hypogaea]|uniref:Uncharacterized protein n=1 Tax=Arachis hypogaea TaxID=3818 RepID=A0A445BHW3_ARAHY|nr:hypothetical protein Ahy_A09g043238 [Arachis hypogaea]
MYQKGKWKSNISPTEKTNPSVGLNYPARIYIHILMDVGIWIISKVVLPHSHPCCLNQAKVLKQHRELNIRGHRELSFIEKDVRNYITREVQNVLELEGAKEFEKYILRIKEKNHNLFLCLNLRLISQLSLLFGPTQEAGLSVSILEILFHSIPLTIQTGVFSEFFEYCYLWVPVYLNHHF